jgi:thiamine biosynthesis lipoprotein
MAITLNGIAQGYITDRITDLLRHEGFEHAMVELGETRALGASPDGQPFQVGLMNPASPGLVDRTVALADQALSVSGGYGLRFGGDAHHIFDPATGRSANRLLDVAVIAPRAIHADALSTAIFVAGEELAPAILRAYPPARAMITRTDGSTATL